MTITNKTYKKGDPEYRANGLYVVNDVTYMSLWSYKMRRGDLVPTHKNSEHGRMLARLGVKGIHTIPDHGGFTHMLCYNKELLDSLTFI